FHFPSSLKCHAAHPALHSFPTRRSSDLATMATAAVVAGRSAERTASAAALASNGDLLGTVFATAFGNSTGTQFDNVWTAKDAALDRKSTRLNSSHVEISYAVFCLKKKKK